MAGIVAAEMLGLGLAVTVAIGAVVLGRVELIGGWWLLVVLAGALVVSAAFTGWLCGPRVLEPWRGYFAPHSMAAVTASISTAALILAGLLFLPPMVAAVRGTLDPASGSLWAAFWAVLFYGIPTAIAALLSLVVTVPMGLVWAWLTRRLIARA